MAWVKDKRAFAPPVTRVPPESVWHFGAALVGRYPHFRLVRRAKLELFQGRVCAISHEPFNYSNPPQADFDRRDSIVLPGLVNAHSHLELSWLRGHTSRNLGMASFVRQMIDFKQKEGKDDQKKAMASAINEALWGGTLLIGDVTNEARHLSLLASSPLSGRLFVELLGPDPDKAHEILLRGRALVQESREMLRRMSPLGQWQVSLAPHAPYSMSLALQRKLRDEIRHNRDGLASLHFLESAAEKDFLQWGKGPLAESLAEGGHESHPFALTTEEGRWYGASGAAHFWSLANLLWVHGNYIPPKEIVNLAPRLRGVVLCPRSNRYIGHSPAPMRQLQRAGACLALGTDSLASNDSLSMAEEMAQAVADYGISPAEALSLATEGGASALGFGDRAALDEGQRAFWYALPLEGLGEAISAGGGINRVNRLWERIFSWSSWPDVELFVSQGV